MRLQAIDEVIDRRVRCLSLRRLRNHVNHRGSGVSGC